ncbi:RNA polymerase sigma-70 factor, partial [Dysgonomonas sp. Marseille-P4677]|uniref:RNA polymerase sigma-70 factor n=1 Tax=Dysgonomonas sp. Marseille-P4677 TaxID=2364790 RepID=UPI0019143244
TKAFNTLYNQFFTPLCVFASRYITDQQAIEDCVQDVFLKIWRDKENITISSSIRSYLITATRNNCLNIIEKEKNQTSYEQYILNTYDVYTTQDLLSVEEIEKIIENALQQLPEKHRIVFKMSRFENMTYKEIAEKQNISIKTVESYIHKSLISLSILLKDYYPFIILFLYYKKI